MVKVKVVKAGAYLVMRWKDLASGKPKQKAAGTNDRRKANRLAAKLEKELHDGTYFVPSKLLWSEFREQFEELRFPNLKPGTGAAYECTFNMFENLMSPHRLSLIDANVIARFQNRLRKHGRAESTVAKHLRHLKAALNWAQKRGWIQSTPLIEMPKLGRHQRLRKGRGITDKEFQDLLNAVSKVVGDDSAESWQDLLKQYWLSGLRLDELLRLTWHESEGFHLDMHSQKRPVILIDAKAEKGGQDRIHPITRDYVEYLQDLGVRESGFVVNPGRVNYGRKSEFRRNKVWISNVISRIGREAGIVVSTKNNHTKYVSAQDLRRSFAERWAKVATPTTLMTLMRHKSIETTLRYYVGNEAEKIGDEIWDLEI